MGSLGPGGGSDFGDLGVLECGQAGEQIVQVSVRIDASSSAAFNHGVDNGTALACSSFAHEKPVLLADRRGPDGVLDQVIVDLHLPFPEEDFQPGPLAKGVIDGLAQEALGQMLPAGFELKERFLDAIEDRTALLGAHGGTQFGAGLRFAQGAFDPVKVLDLAQDPAGAPRRLFQGLVELPAGVRPASGQLDFVASFFKGGVGAVAIALQHAFKVTGNESLKTLRRPAGFPAIEHVPARTAGRPEIALFGLPMTRGQVSHGRFVDLRIATGQHAGADLFVDRLKPIGAPFHPAGESRTGEIDLVALGKDLFLPVERKVIAILADQDVREQPRTRQAPFQ